ncbi:MAG: metal-dependent hydrolase [Gemmatimonadaceae bacterium]
MDNVTHALAGCLLAVATVAIVERNGIKTPRNFRAVATTVGIIAAELPDSDLIYAGPRLGMGSLGYLLHHRGHTHTVLFAVIGALLVWLAALALSRDSRRAPMRIPLLVLALVGTMSHLALDYTNNYGIHPFWPVVNTWYYGDAVFIVEPWLWIVSIPALYLFYRGRTARAVLALLLGIILVASWAINMVTRDVAIAFSIATLVWFVVLQATTPARRVGAAIGAWVFVELVFMNASLRARDAVRAAVGETYRDVSLTPLIGNPLCYSAIVVEADSTTYRVTDATVAPFASIRGASTCAGEPRGGTGSKKLSTRNSTEGIRWGSESQQPLADLINIVRTSCEAAAAMEFIRVPVWQETQADSVQLGDARFGSANSGFATVTASLHPTSCPRFVPGWTSPRADVLN